MLFSWKSALVRILLLLLFSFNPAIAHAEVMDKEHSFLSITVFTVLAALSTYFAARLKPKTLLFLLPVISLFVFGHLAELLDPHVGSAILHEAGLLYVVISWCSPIVIILFGFIGLIVRRRSKISAAP